MLRTTLLAVCLLAVHSQAIFVPASAGTAGALVITCPPDAKFACGSATDPDTLGHATATSDCPGPITITHQDVPAPTLCLAQRFQTVIQRVWTATDACGNVASCTQDIDVVRQLWSLDIKPTSCPNPIKIGTNGGGAVVSIAVLGTASQDVTRIDTSTVQIWLEGCAAGPVAPFSANYQDVAAPYQGGISCGCTTAGPDGLMDLRLGFHRDDLVQGLGLAQFPSFTTVRLVLTARTTDGCEIVATDCVRVQ